MDIREIRNNTRLFGISWFDAGGTLLIAYFHSKYFKINTMKTIIGYFIIGEIMHIILGVETPITKIFSNIFIL